MPIFIQLTPAWFFGIAGGALLVVGLLNVFKRFFQDPNTGKSKAPWWVWHIAMILLSIGLSFAAGGGRYWIMIDAVGLMTFAQLGYLALVKLPSAIIKGVAEKAGVKLDTSSGGDTGATETKGV